MRAAQALEKAFQQHAADRGADYEIRHVDTLDYTNKVFRQSGCSSVETSC